MKKIGAYIRVKVIPADLSVKEVAEKIGIGRPALSNFLNGKTRLSNTLALRLEKVFGVSHKDLLQRQLEFEQEQAPVAVGPISAYVPFFLKISASQIEEWAAHNIEARSRLSVFLRKLIHSTNAEVSRIDFPGYSNAERKGWDGWVEAAVPTPWVPAGNSGWEFGCNDNPRQKANDDFHARTKSLTFDLRTTTSFIFVTPRNWKDKNKWAAEKQSTGEWKSVRAYDASDLEQWLEHSIQAQGWLAAEIGVEAQGVNNIEQSWQTWANAAQPPLSKVMFEPSVRAHTALIGQWLEAAPSRPLIICADSKQEALAFLACVLDTDALGEYRDRAVVFSTDHLLRKLALAPPPGLVAIVFTEEVERELGSLPTKLHTVIVRPRNTVESGPDISLDILNYEGFTKGLEAMGITDRHRIDQLSTESGNSPTILRRRLSSIPAIRTPGWAANSETRRMLLSMVLVGTWHAQSPADCKVMATLAGREYPELEKNVAELLRFDDPPIWAVEQVRGVASKIDAFFAVQSSFVSKDFEDFLSVAKLVLGEADPALELPADKRGFAALYNKSRQYSRALREGICESLALLAVHGNSLFGTRLGIDVESRITLLVRDLLTPLTPDRLMSQVDDLPFYAEAAPDEVLRIIEADLKSPEPSTDLLLRPAESGAFGSCSRTGLLWALENLAWKPERLLPVSLVMAKLAERKITDNWANKPAASLESLYRCWMPQTSASLEIRKKALEALTRKFPAIAWEICVEQFSSHQRAASSNYRPRWRDDATGAGQVVTNRERWEMSRKAFDLALAWPNHNENTLGDLVMQMQSLPEEDQYRIWDLIKNWAKNRADDRGKAELGERIRRYALTDRSARRGLDSEIRLQSREVADLLTPADIVMRHEWLFRSGWVEPSADEVHEERLDYEKSQARISEARAAALETIWRERALEGILALASISGALGVIGWHLAAHVISPEETTGFIKDCLASTPPDVGVEKINELLRGFLASLPNEGLEPLLSTLVPQLPAGEVVRLLKSAPFVAATWAHVDGQSPEVQAQYWREVFPGWMPPDSPDINESVDRLIAAGRPLLAFNTFHYMLEKVETARLARLLRQIATCPNEEVGANQISAHDISEAFDLLQKRSGVGTDELAGLEFMFIQALDDTKHGIPNLERQIGRSPALFVHALSLIYKRSDKGVDPPEWRIDDPARRSSIANAAWHLIRAIKRVPGTAEDGTVDIKGLRAWVLEARALCAEQGRAEIGDQMIGQILAEAPEGKDGIRPCEPVREVMEEIGSEEIARGFTVAVRNSRGVWSRSLDEGGEQERALAEKFRQSSQQIAFDYPYVSRILADLAKTYEHEGSREDSQAIIRKRVGR
jgi:plasmid maintenance system antidote protein VapI